jgi:cytidylate kinase
MSHSIVIAVDGPAASGKGTLARRLARHFNFAHMDSGALYRLTALSVLESGGDPTRESDAIWGARSIDLSRAGDPAIRTDVIGIAASRVSAIPAVRAALHDFQTSFLAHPTGGSLGAVMDGRDIGTVIAPAAAAKLYIEANPEIRARRRWLELKALGVDKDLEILLGEIRARDHADRTRAISPLRRAEDADLLDTSNLDIDAAFAAALALVEPKVLPILKGRAQGPSQGL